MIMEPFLLAADMLDAWENHWHGISTARATDHEMDAYRLRFQCLVAKQKGLAQQLREMAHVAGSSVTAGRAVENERLRKALDQAEQIIKAGRDVGVSGDVSLRLLKAAMLGIHVDDPRFEELL